MQKYGEKEVREEMSTWAEDDDGPQQAGPPQLQPLGVLV